MAAVIRLGTGNAAVWLAASAFDRVVRLMCIIAIAAATYFATLWVVGFRLRDFSQRAAE